MKATTCLGVCGCGCVEFEVGVGVEAEVRANAEAGADAAGLDGAVVDDDDILAVAKARLRSPNAQWVGVVEQISGTFVGFRCQ
jgi:hypothetical protein